MGRGDIRTDSDEDYDDYYGEDDQATSGTHVDLICWRHQIYVYVW